MQAFFNLPLIQFRQTVETTLRGMTNISKPFVILPYGQDFLRSA